MIVVADSSPLHYLILIEQVDMLRQLYAEVVVPEAVFAELTRPASPVAVSGWLVMAPSWLRVVPVTAEEMEAVTESLDAGERAAIALAATFGADLLLIDEAAGRREASRRVLHSSPCPRRVPQSAAGGGGHMRVRALTAHGIQQFREFLAHSQAEVLDAPKTLLSDPTASVEVEPEMQVSERSFANRLDLARYLHETLQGVDRTVLTRSVGIWSWLSLFYFDQIAPKGDEGRRTIYEEARYILTTERRAHRHLIAGAFKIYDLAGEKARVILNPPVSTHGDFAEQLSARMEFITNPGLIALVDMLYFDEKTIRPKRGATNRKKEGTLRRLIDVLQQLDLTYDLYGMNVDEFLPLLPKEFDRWKPRQSQPS
jgi:predicted nucleic acid-binding protein